MAAALFLTFVVAAAIALLFFVRFTDADSRRERQLAWVGLGLGVLVVLFILPSGLGLVVGS